MTQKTIGAIEICQQQKMNTKLKWKWKNKYCAESATVTEKPMKSCVSIIIILIIFLARMNLSKDPMVIHNVILRFEIISFNHLTYMSTMTCVRSLCQTKTHNCQNLANPIRQQIQLFICMKMKFVAIPTFRRICSHNSWTKLNSKCSFFFESKWSHQNGFRIFYENYILKI